MANDSQAHIFLVDGETELYEVVTRSLKPIGAKISSFTYPLDCLRQLSYQACDLLITEVRLPEMDGIDFLNQAKCLIPTLPLLIITDSDDISIAVKAMKVGASDVIQKPINMNNLLASVKSTLKQAAPVGSFDPNILTKTELRILHLLVDGNTNKSIARLLCRSVRTIEDHRSNIMRKLEVDNIVNLIRKAALLGLVNFKKKD